MIKYNPKSWFKLIFALHKSDTMRMLWKELLYMTVLSLLIAWVEITYFPDTQKILNNLTSVYSLIGFVISLLLVFRTNTAYERWWEGRKKWGEIVNDARNVSVKINALIQNEEDKVFFAQHISNFCFASKEHLKEGVVLEELILSDLEYDKLMKSSHIPMTIMGFIYDKLYKLKAAKIISEQDFLAIDFNLNHFLDSLGACERIKNTPIPFSYSLFIKKFIFIYTATLPLAFISMFGYYSTIISVFIFYVLVSMEVLAEEIEDPFGSDDNDLPTDILCHKIRADVNSVLLQNFKD